MFREILFFFWDIGYVTKHRGILRIDLESNGNDETKNIHIYFFGIFMTGAMGKVGYKTLFSIASWKWVWNTFKIFFFFFLVRETNRAMYNLQVETETRTNQYQFPVYFGPKLQPKKKTTTPSCQFCLGGRNFMERQFCVERCETFIAVPEAQRILSTGSVSTYWPPPLL